MVVLGPGAESGSPGHAIWALTQLYSLASSHILENQTLQGTVQEMRGALVDLQESSLRCTELQEENQQLRKQVTVGGVQNIRPSRWQVEHPGVGGDVELGEMRNAGQQQLW